ncbi:3-oxoacyl-[acyl-carrier-protein] synthase-1 [Desulfonema ishimotonii]|uniref:3-oxoacyl-[acyl-carrier-protein] synthase-1 n=1 Tax=Desulfonema ishimotonii TaxID=45657 RepID=A0A401FYU2_9BACT|nr:beta-ketoacyl synthase [Desulfonema ishimotonii]GBC62134.1 3-oxoacyl-[acyl-carrier-protein] synthase-1 [Desulfonema ishimotonii]
MLTGDRVCIIGVGALTSVGLHAASTAAAVRAGISGFAEHPYMINREGEPYVLAMVPGIDPYITGTRRYTGLAIPAMAEALLVLDTLKLGSNIPIIIGLPEKRPGLPDDLPAALSESTKKMIGKKFSTKEIRTLSKGHSAGLMALKSGSKLIAGKACEFCVVGGVDSYTDPDTLDWTEDNGQLHNPSNAWGFIPGEAAGFCVICSGETADKYRLPVKAELAAISTAVENNKIKTETVCIGQGLTQVVRNAVEALQNRPKIDQVICDQNGEAYRADEFGFMLARLSESFKDPSDYMAPADCWGDVGAASGPLFINLITSAAEKRYAKGPCTLLWTSSEDGERAAAIFLTAAR